jgi:hypothetical protein
MTDDDMPSMGAVAVFAGDAAKVEEMEISLGRKDDTLLDPKYSKDGTFNAYAMVKRPAARDMPSLPFGARKVRGKWVCGNLGCEGTTVKPARGQLERRPENVACARHVKEWRLAFLEAKRHTEAQEIVSRPGNNVHEDVAHARHNIPMAAAIV